MTNPDDERFTRRNVDYAAGMQRVEMTAREKGSIVQVVNERGRALSMNEAEEFAVVSTLALQLERKDRDGLRYEDADMRTSKAALKGAVTGLLIAEAVYGSQLTTKEILAAVDIKNEVALGGEQNREAVNEALIDIGSAALERLVPMDSMMNQWESACVDSLSHQYYFRLGFGLIVGSASKAVYSKDLELLEQEINTAEYDWNQGLSELLDP